MFKSQPVQPAWATESPLAHETHETIREIPDEFHAATFDTSSSLSDMKKLQDPNRFKKARFNLRLYKR